MRFEPTSVRPPRGGSQSPTKMALSAMQPKNRGEPQRGSTEELPVWVEESGDVEPRWGSEQFQFLDPGCFTAWPERAKSGCAIVSPPSSNAVKDFYRKKTGLVKGIAGESTLRLSHECSGRL